MPAGRAQKNAALATEVTLRVAYLYTKPALGFKKKGTRALRVPVFDGLVPVAETASAAATALAVTAATAASKTASTAAKAAAFAHFRTGFVHIQHSRTKLGSVDSVDGLLGLLVVRHFYKAKTSRLASITVF